VAEAPAAAIKINNLEDIHRSGRKSWVLSLPRNYFSVSVLSKCPALPDRAVGDNSLGLVFSKWTFRLRQSQPNMTSSMVINRDRPEVLVHSVGHPGTLVQC
jgi:hypothetical protein